MVLLILSNSMQRPLLPHVTESWFMVHINNISLFVTVFVPFQNMVQFLKKLFIYYHRGWWVKSIGGFMKTFRRAPLMWLNIFWSSRGVHEKLHGSHTDFWSITCNNVKIHGALRKTLDSDGAYETFWLKVGVYIFFQCSKISTHLLPVDNKWKPL